MPTTSMRVRLRLTTVPAKMAAIMPYNGDIEKALAAYNAGSARIDSGRVPAESERYVRNVMALYRRYREEE